jgi:hypothetical protein
MMTNLSLVFGLAASLACVAHSSPQPADKPPAVTIRLNERAELLETQVGQLRDANISIELVEARGPRAGCDDCPLNATLRIRSGAESVDLSYQFSGNMPPDRLKLARRKTAFGHAVIAVSIADGRMTLYVTRVSPKIV